MNLCIDDPATVQAIVLASDAVSRSTPVQIESGLRSGELRVLPVRLAHATVSYGFVSIENRRLSPAAELFVSIVRQIEAELGVRNRTLIEELISETSQIDALATTGWRPRAIGSVGAGATAGAAMGCR
jgi:hypothetical protein